MKNNASLRHRALIYTTVALVLSAFSALLRLLTLILCYDASIGYFRADELLPILSDALSVASVLFFAVIAILWFRKKDVSYAKRTSLSLKIAAGLCSIVSLVLGIYDLKASASVLGLLFCFGACLYFLLILSDKTLPWLALIFGFCPIFRLLSVLADAYVDFYVPMNSPQKVCFFLGIIAAMFFLVSEIRALVTRPYSATYLFSAATAVLITGSTSVFMLIGSLTHRFYGNVNNANTLVALLLLTVAIYAGVRLVTVALNPTPIEETQEAEATEVAEVAEETEETEETEPSEENDQQ